LQPLITTGEFFRLFEFGSDNRPQILLSASIAKVTLTYLSSPRASPISASTSGVTSLTVALNSFISDIIENRSKQLRNSGSATRFLRQHQKEPTEKMPCAPPVGLFFGTFVGI
jgi:integral membrane sensor domain MASE1